MRLFWLISFLLFYCNNALAFVCEGDFQEKIKRSSPKMAEWNWSYLTDNVAVFGDQHKFDSSPFLSIGAVEDKVCIASGECIVSNTVCAVKTSLQSLLNETEEVDKPIRLRVVSYGVYFTLMEQIMGDLKVAQTCEQAHERYYIALKDFWTGALRDIGYRVADVYPFEVKFELKPEYLRDDECFHRIDEVKDRIISLKTSGDPYGLVWARIGFGVSWYGADFFPAFDIVKEEIKAN